VISFSILILQQNESGNNIDDVKNDQRMRVLVFTFTLRLRVSIRTTKHLLTGRLADRMVSVGHLQRHMLFTAWTSHGTGPILRQAHHRAAATHTATRGSKQ